MLLQDTEKSTTLFLHGQFCIMLIEHDKLQDEDEDDDVEADFPEYSMYQRIIYLRRSPADIRYVGSGNIDDCAVEVVCEWTQLRGALIENYMHCYRLNKIEW
jgi:hypothetical protein